MFKFIAALVVVASLFAPVLLPALGAATADQKAAPAEKCAQHGVKKTLCTRCNPKLAALFKARGDWCAEHERPETQCVLCHPELAKDGVK